MHVTIKRNTITQVTAPIEIGGQRLHCTFYPTTKRLWVHEMFGKARPANTNEKAGFLFEVFGCKQDALDKLDREMAAGKIGTGTKVKAVTFQRAALLVEQALQ